MFDDMRVRAFAVGLFIVLCMGCMPVSAQLMSGCWSKFHSDACNTGQSSASGPAGSALGWSYLAEGAVTGDPVTDSSGNIYFVCQDTYIYSLTKEGELRWRAPLQSAGRGAPAISNDGTIYVGSDLTYLYAYSIAGTLKWRKLLGGKLGASPAIGPDKTIYTPCLDKNLYALNSQGTQKWAYSTGGALRSCPAVSDGVIYVGSDDTYLYAIYSNGTLKWRYKFPSAVSNSAAVGSDGVIYAVSSNGKLVALNPSGTLKWQYTISSQVDSSPAIGPSGTIYVGAEDGKLYAITSTGSLAWSFQTSGPVRSSAAVGGNGVMYVGSEDGSIYAIKPNGTAMWSASLGGAVSSSPAIGADGTLMVGGGNKLHTFPPDSTPPSTPVVTDGGVYSSSADSLSASWESFDEESGISESHYAIGTSPGGTDVLDWVSAGSEFSVTHTGLTLVDGQVYYFAVKTRNGAGLWSEVGVSDGIMVDASPPVTPVVTDDGEYISGEQSLHAQWSSSDPHTGVAEYQYAIGTTAGSANVVDWTSVGTATEVTRSGLELVDGTTYYISVKAKNGAGMWSAVGSSDGIMADSSPPTQPAVTDDGEYTSSQTSLHATWTASDPHSGIAEYQYAIGTSAGATDVVGWTSTGALTSVTKTGLSLETGKTYYFSVKAKNRAGLWGEVGVSDGILCDATPPSTPVVIDDGEYTSSTNSLHAAWSSGDPESGVAGYQYAIGSTPGGTSIVNWTSVGTATEITRTGLALTPGATYYISVKATNGAGLVSAVGTSDGIKVDNSPPTTPVVTDDGVYTTDATTLHATWTSGDLQSGIVEYQYAIGTSSGGTNVVDWTSAGTATEVTRSGLELVDGTTYYISVKAKNGAGMWSLVGSSDGIMVDSSPPTAPVVTDDGEFTSSQTSLHATWTAYDTHSGIAEYQYAIGTSAGATDVVGWTSTGAVASITKTGLSLETGKTYYFSVKAKNKAGLWGSVGVSDGILCDATPPTTPVVIDDGEYASSTNSLHATWSTSDPESGVVSYQYAIGSTPGGANIVNWTSVGTATEVTRTGLALTPGTTYYISVKATNGAGLVSAVGTSDGIKVDNSPPTTPVVTDDGVYTTDATTLHATWTSGDLQSGIVEYQYAIGTSSGGTNIVDWTSVGTATEVTRSGLELVDGATYYISVKAKNGAGMWSAVGSSDGIMADSSPPTQPAVTDDGEYTSSQTSLHAAWTASDPHSGIAEYQYAIGTSAGSTDVVGWTSTGAVASITKTGLSLETGKTYYFSVKAKNKAGLWGEVGVSDGILCDATPPTTPVVIDDGEYTSSTNSLHATWSSGDPESGVVSYQYAIGSMAGGANIVNWTSVGTATEITRNGLALTPGTTYYISVRATNGAGLVSAVGTSDGIKVDNSPPTTPVVTDDGVYTTDSTTLHATWTSGDPQSGVVEYQYAIGTTAGSANIVDWTSVGTATEVTRSGLELVDGATYYISVKAKNGAGMWSAVGSSDGIMADSSPPSQPAVTDDGEYTSSLTSLHATWTASDPHSGIAEYQYAIGTSAGATDVVGWTSTGAVASVTKSGLSLETGKTYYFSIKAKNKAGLWGSVGVSDGILCDATPPSTPVVIDDGEYTSSTNSLHATWSSSDPESGVVSYQYAIGSTPGGTSIVNWTSVGTATEITRTGLALSPGTTYYISVKATNGAGLVSAVGTSDGIKVDNSPPTTPVVTDDGVYTTDATTLHATWTSGDLQSGIAEYQYAIGTTAGSTNVADWTSVGTATEVTRSGLELVDGTSYYISVKAKNGAGMWSAIGSSDGIMVDSSPPTTPVVTDDGEYTSSLTSLHAAWTASDPHSGIAEYQYAIGTYASATDVVGWTSTGVIASVTKIGLSLETGKTYYFSVKAKNKAGLWGPVGVSDGILCDATPPSTPVVIDDGEYTSSTNSLHATWSSSDPESGIVSYQYAIGSTAGGANIVNWTSVGTATEITRAGLALSPGTTYYISVKATNGAGVVSAVGTSDGIKVDNSPPTTPVVTDDGVYTTDATTLHATWASSDPQSGIAEYQYAIGTTAGSANIVDWTSVGTATEVTRSGLELVDGATYYISVKAKNGAGMWSAVGSSDGIMADSSPPSQPAVTDDGEYTSSLTSLHATWTASDPHSGIAEYQYAIGTSAGATDVVGWTSTGAVASVTKSGLSLETGKTYYFSIKAKNKAGLWGSVGVSDGILCDATPPSTPVVIDDGEYTSSTNSLHATWSSSDTESGIVSYQYAIGSMAGGTNIVNWTSVGTATEITRNGLALTPGTTYYISVRATNGAGLVSAVGTSDGIKVDNSPPTTPIVTDDGVYTTDATTLHAIWTSGDPQSGIVEYQYAIGTSSGGTNVVDWTSVGTATEVTRSGLELVDGTTYYISVKAKNGAGMWSAVGSSDGIMVDSSPPSQPTVTDDGEFTSSQTSLHATWMASDPHSGIADYQYAIGTSAGATDVVGWTSTGAIASVTKIGLSLETGKTYYFSVKAKNKAGLWGPVGVSDGILCDATPPTTPVVIDDGEYTSSTNSLHATWSSSDPESGVVSYQYAIGSTAGGANIVNWTSVGTATEITRTGLALTPGTTYYISVKATNGAGLVSAVGTSDGIKVDNSPPTTPVVTDDGVYTTDATTLHATWTSGDPQSGIAEYQYAIGTTAGSANVADWTSVGAAAEVTRSGLELVDGTTYYISVKAKNGAGMWSSVGSSDGILVDSSPPTTPVVTDDGDYTTVPNLLHATWSANDPHTGVVEYQYAIGTVSGGTDVVEWTDVGLETSVTLTNITLIPGKQYYFAVKAKNAAGLWSTVGVSDGIRIDITPPSAPHVIDEGEYTSSLTSLSAQWLAVDPESGISDYEYCIGTVPGGTDIVGWTSSNGANHITHTGLSLTMDLTYYFTVRAKNGVGMWGQTGTSDGIVVRILIAWPKFRNNSQNLGVSPFIGPAVPGLLSSYETGWGITSSVAIGGDGTLYFGNDEGYMYCVGPNGILHWRYKTGGPIDSSPAIGPGGDIVFSSYDHYIYCLTADGLLRWKYKTGDWSRSSPVISSNNVVYVGSQDGYMYAINWNGTLKWKHNINNTVWSSPALSHDESVLYFGGGDGGIYCLNAKTGDRIWRKKTGTAVDSSPCVAPDGTIYMGSGDGYFYALNPDGTQKWALWTGDLMDSSASVGPSGTIYTGSGDNWAAGLLYAINPDGSVKWTFDCNGSIRCSPAVDAAENIYFASTDDHLYALNSSGALKWQYETHGLLFSSPAIGRGGSISFGTALGAMITIGDASNDITPPSTPVVSVPNSLQTDTSTLSASWYSTDPESGIVEYMYGIGTVPGTDDVIAWSSIGSHESVVRTGLKLIAGQTYYFCVKAKNGAGKWGAVGISEGVHVISSTQESSIGQARLMADTQVVYLKNKIVSAVFEDCIYIQEPAGHAGIKVFCGEIDPPAVGDKVSITAAVTTRYAEKSLIPQTLTVEDTSGTPKALGMTNSAVIDAAAKSGFQSIGGACTTGLLVVIWGEVTKSEDEYIYVDDGSGVIDPTGERGIKVRLCGQAVAVGSYVRITGVVSTEPAGSCYRKVIRTRSQSDISYLEVGS
ncbi:MAG: PQQ-binding-like beta-propeller repeat protein [Armatimonadota bacterium]